VNLLKYALAGALFAGFAGSAMAQPIDNPWEGDGAEVNININVGAIGEVWSTVGTNQARFSHPALELDIDNAGGFLAPTGIAWDTVSHFANVNYDVYTQISALSNIPEWTRFHILWGIQNRGAYNAVNGNLVGQTNAIADTIVTYDRRDAGTGYIGNQPGTPVLVDSGTAGPTANSDLVDYAADAIHGLPPQTTGAAVEVIYTIAQQ
jgi:hypothetical protein